MVRLCEFENMGKVVWSILSCYLEDSLGLRKTTKAPRMAGWAHPEYKWRAVAASANLFDAFFQSTASGTCYNEVF
jgi:hypothetical protein